MVSLDGGGIEPEGGVLAPAPGHARRHYGWAGLYGRSVARRSAILGTLGALAAGILAGAGFDRLTGEGARPRSGLPAEREPLVESEFGHWQHVAHAAEVPNGAIRPFSAGALHGFLINRDGQYRAVSGVCTHLGCTLSFQDSVQSLVCPCHGAQFALDGRQRFGGTAFRLRLPPLSEIDVRVRGSSVQVWTA
jgi:nitrite reductase/ring-hydroxylating ferredoxin subunit